MTHAPEPWSNPRGTLVVDADMATVATVNSNRPDGCTNGRLIVNSARLLRLAKEVLLRADWSEDCFQIFTKFGLEALIREIEG